jgi:hypothetical protein
MTEKQEKNNWLEENGYILNKIDGSYFFVYRDGLYYAVNTFGIIDLIEMPLQVMKDYHDRFMEKAKNEELF